MTAIKLFWLFPVPFLSLIPQSDQKLPVAIFTGASTPRTASEVCKQAIVNDDQVNLTAGDNGVSQDTIELESYRVNSSNLHDIPSYPFSFWDGHRRYQDASAFIDNDSASTKRRWNPGNASRKRNSGQLDRTTDSRLDTVVVRPPNGNSIWLNAQGATTDEYWNNIVPRDVYWTLGRASGTDSINRQIPLWQSGGREPLSKLMQVRRSSTVENTIRNFIFSGSRILKVRSDNSETKQCHLTLRPMLHKQKGRLVCQKTGESQLKLEKAQCFTGKPGAKARNSPVLSNTRQTSALVVPKQLLNASRQVIREESATRADTPTSDSPRQVLRTTNSLAVQSPIYQDNSEIENHYLRDASIIPDNFRNSVRINEVTRKQHQLNLNKYIVKEFSDVRPKTLLMSKKTTSSIKNTGKYMKWLPSSVPVEFQPVAGFQQSSMTADIVSTYLDTLIKSSKSLSRGKHDDNSTDKLCINCTSNANSSNSVRHHGEALNSSWKMGQTEAAINNMDVNEQRNSSDITTSTNHSSNLISTESFSTTRPASMNTELSSQYIATNLPDDNVQGRWHGRQISRTSPSTLSPINHNSPDTATVVIDSSVAPDVERNATNINHNDNSLQAINQTINTNRSTISLEKDSLIKKMINRGLKASKLAIGVREKNSEQSRDHHQPHNTNLLKATFMNPAVKSAPGSIVRPGVISGQFRFR